MRLRALAAAVAVAAGAAAAPARGAGADADHESDRPWYQPDHAKLQLAGNVGFVSPGVGWAWRDGAIHADALLGWVPEFVGGNLLSATAKLTARPWPVRAGRLELRPITLGVQLTYAFGGSYFVEQPSRFPGGYYPFPTALRSGLAIGGAASWRWGHGGKGVGVYYELVALDHLLVAWYRNRSALPLDDVFSLALGVSLEF